MKPLRHLPPAWLTILPPPYLPATAIQRLEISKSLIRFICPAPLPAKQFIFKMEFVRGKTFLEGAGRLIRTKKTKGGYLVEIGLVQAMEKFIRRIESEF